MDFRGVSILIAAVLALAACNSPGKPYAYLDVLIQPSVSSSVPQPSTSQAFVLTFPVRNTHNQELTVAYDIRKNVIADPIDPASGAVAQSGTVAVPAFGTVHVALNVPAQAAGPHAWSIILDPAGLIAERSEANNAATLTVNVADFDVTFAASPAPTVVSPIPVAGDLTLTFSITNTNNAAAAAPTPADVNIDITIDGATPVAPTSIMSGDPAAADPLPISVAAGATVPVTITVPRPAIGNHTYTIVLVPTVPDASTANNTVMVSVPVAN